MFLTTLASRALVEVGLVFNLEVLFVVNVLWDTQVYNAWISSTLVLQIHVTMEAVLQMEHNLLASAMKDSLVVFARLKYRVACADMEDACLRLRIIFASVKSGTQGNSVKYARMTPVPRCHVRTVPVWREMVVQNVCVTRDTLDFYVI